MRTLKKALLGLMLALCCMFLLVVGGAWFFTLVEGRSKPLPNVGNRAEVFAMLHKTDGDSRPLSFAVMGDIQQGIGEFESMLEVMRKRGHTDFIIQCGDIVTQGDDAHYRFVLNEFAEATDVNIPMFMVPGNHDSRPEYPTFERYFGARTFCFEYRKCLFIGLDNAVSQTTDGQLADLERVLSDRRAAVDHVFMFMHRAAVPGAAGGDPQDYVQDSSAPRILALCQKYRVDYVFAGHSRAFYRTRSGCTNFVVNGRGGAIHTGWPSTPAFMVLVEVNGERITDETEAVDSSLDPWDSLEYYTMGQVYPSTVLHPFRAGVLVLAAVGMGAFCVIRLFRSGKPRSSDGTKGK